MDQLAGRWVFNPLTSRLNSQSPVEWVQNVDVQGSRLRVREEIHRDGNLTLVEVDAQVDGTFYPVTGTVIADEMAYRLTGEALEGVGRREGAPAFREKLTINADDELVLELQFQVGKREIAVGAAHFKRQTWP